MKRQFLLKIASAAAVFAVLLTGCSASETTSDLPADGTSASISDSSAQSGDAASGNGSGDNSEDKTSSDSSDDKTSSDNSDDKTSSGNSDDKTSGDSSDDKTSGDSSDDKTSGDNSDDKTSGDNSDDKTSGDSSDDKTSGDNSDDKTSGDSSDDKTSGGNAQTQKPQTDAPATKPAQTEAPATKAPQTNPPATKPPQTQAPATKPPQTEAPATKAPVATKAPAATKAPEKPATCTNHKWKVSTVIKEATCYREGRAEYTCTVCGAKKTDTLVKDHSWETKKYADGDKCVLSQKCTVCGATHSEFGQHEYQRTKNVESTSTKDGYTTYSCTKCGDGFTLTQKAGTNNNMPMKYNDIYNKLIAFKSKYKEGMAWDNSKVYKTTYTDSKGIKTNFTANGCMAFALEISDSLFKGKDIPKNYTFNINKLRIGDMLRLNNDTHTVLILDVGPEGVVIAEGNYNSSVHWGRFISASELKSAFTYSMTRY